MRNLDSKFIKRKINNEKLIEYGFKKVGDSFIFKKDISDEFEVKVEISDQVKTSCIIDLFDGLEYALVDVEEAQGEFVGSIRSKYEEIIDDIIEKCTIFNTFIFPQTARIMEYIKEKYGDELEFLWDDFDGAAIRNKTNEKWYLVYMAVGANKVKPTEEEKTIDVIDIKYDKDKVEEVINNIGIYPGYHMNKHSWITIVLDDSEDDKKIEELIDKSYILSGGNKTGMKKEEIAQKVYDYLTTIPKGKVVTYGQIAKAIGNRGLSRLVGTALHNNPDGKKYPCFKVLNSKGELAEDFVFGGAEVQKKLLEEDGIEVKDNRVDLKKYQWKK